MSLPRQNDATRIADRLNELSSLVKVRSRLGLTDANLILETIMIRFFNALFGWDLESLNVKRANYPAADLGDLGRKLAIQVTNQERSEKIYNTAIKAAAHELGKDFDHLIIFFLLSKKPKFPTSFVQMPGNPKIETWDIADLLGQLVRESNLDVLASAANVLDEEMGKIPRNPIDATAQFSPMRLPDTGQYLVGRSAELRRLTRAWNSRTTNIVSVIAAGGIGKTQLVKRWTNRLATKIFDDTRIYEWSFYSQGTDQQGTGDQFIDDALRWFGEENPSRLGEPAEKGVRLAELVKECRSLLILDGLEPLQNPPGPFEGRIADPAIDSLLRALCHSNPGLCVITSRVPVRQLESISEPLHVQIELPQLEPKEGAGLLQALGAVGTKSELEEAARQYDGHALALTLLGTYLKQRFNGDISEMNRLVDHVNLLDGKERYALHARKIIDQYVNWFLDPNHADEISRIAVAILRLTGLFNRPMDSGCIRTLRAGPIEGLTESLFDRVNSEKHWQLAVQRLRDARLLAKRFNGARSNELDCHPLIREFFAEELREKFAQGARQAHRRLYEYLKSTANERPASLREMSELYLAAWHGVRAGDFQSVLDEVIIPRLRQGEHGIEHMSWYLGGVSSDLSLFSSYFTEPFKIGLQPLDDDSSRAWIYNETGSALRAHGRLHEAAEIIREAMDYREKLGQYFELSRAANNLALTSVAAGEITAAADAAKQAIVAADCSGNLSEKFKSRCNASHVLHLRGDLRTALTDFEEAERSFYGKLNCDLPYLIGLQGVQFCDLLIDIGRADQALNRLERFVIPHTSPRFVRDVGLAHLCKARALVVLANSSELARSSFSEAIEVIQTSSQPNEQAVALICRGSFLLLQGDGLALARNDVQAARSLVDKSEFRFTSSKVDLLEARIAIRKSDTNRAKSLLESVEQFSDAQQLVILKTDCLLAWIEFHLHEEDSANAWRTLRSILKIVERTEYRYRQGEIETLQKELQELD